MMIPGLYAPGFSLGMDAASLSSHPKCSFHCGPCNSLRALQRVFISLSNSIRRFPGNWSCNIVICSLYQATDSGNLLLLGSAFTFPCVFCTWSFRFDNCGKQQSQDEQAYGFSPVCAIRICTSIWHFCAKADPQVSHAYFGKCVFL